MKRFGFGYPRLLKVAAIYARRGQFRIAWSWVRAAFQRRGGAA